MASEMAQRHPPGCAVLRRGFFTDAGQKQGRAWVKDGLKAKKQKRAWFFVPGSWFNEIAARMAWS